MKWNLHREFSSLVLRKLFSDKNTADVTLVAEDNQTIDAHRFVLAHASSLLKNIFVNNPEKHITLHLQGLRYETLVNLVRYIYLGEAMVRKEVWQDFITNASKWNIVKSIEAQDNINEKYLNTSDMKA